jgi:hypothetical protein
MLAQKGIPLHETIEKKDGAFVKDIPINDLKNRYMLIKGATHVQIHEETGAGKINIVVRILLFTFFSIRCYYAWKVLS